MVSWNLSKIKLKVCHYIERQWCWVLLVASIPIFLGVLFFNNGPKVDESEVVLYAISIAAGDLIPAWSGYGHFAMYFPAAVFWLVGKISVFLHAFSDYEVYIQWLFDNGAGYQITRASYFLVHVTTVIVYLIVARRAGVPFVILLVAGFAWIYSADSLLYASYIRVDVLVSLFSALALLILIKVKFGWRQFVGIGIIAGFAGASKYPGLAVIGVLASQKQLYAKVPKAIVMSVAAVIVSLLTFIILQPGYEIVSVIHSAIRNSTTSYRVGVEELNIISRLSFIGSTWFSFEGKAWLPLAILTVFGIFDKKFGLPATVIIALILLPVIFSSQPREYWIIPAIDAIRFLQILGAYKGYLISQKIAEHFKWNGIYAGRVTIIFITVLFLIIGVSRFSQVPSLWASLQQTNTKLEALKWIERHYLDRQPILLDTHFNHMMPSVLSLENLHHARRVSRVFIYDRDKSMSLGEIFNNHLWQTIPQERISKGIWGPGMTIWLGYNTQAYNEPISACYVRKGKKYCEKSQVYPCLKVYGYEECRRHEWSDVSGIDDFRTLKVDMGSNEIVAASGTLVASVREPIKWKSVSSDEHVMDYKMLSSLLFGPVRFSGPQDIDDFAVMSDAQEILFVTSPSVYDRLLPPGRPTVYEGLRVHYSRVLESNMIARFDKVPGPIIEVYRVLITEKPRDSSD